MRYIWLETMVSKTALKQPEVSKLIRELRQLTALTQEEFATLLGVAYGTINRWENGHMQPSPLALKQIKAVLDDLGNSPEPNLGEHSKNLLTKYFPSAKPRA